MPGWINVPVKIETRNKLEIIKKEQEKSANTPISYDKVISDLIDNSTCPLCGKHSGGVHDKCANEEQYKRRTI